MSHTRSVSVLVLGGVALVALGACHPARIGRGLNHADRAVSVGARLDCPQAQGDLTRIEIAADGRSCRYAGSDGREARLAFLDLAGRSAKDALSGTEGELKALVPSAVPANDDDAKGKTTSDGDDDPGGHTRINLPGIHIDTDGNDHAHIRAFGQTIEARGKGAVIHGGWNGKEAVVNAHDGGVEVRAGWFGDHSIDVSYVLAGETAGPSGVRAAGYYAKGPTSGPLVLGVETSKSGEKDADHADHFKDLHKLVNLNVHRS